MAENRESKRHENTTLRVRKIVKIVKSSRILTCYTSKEAESEGAHACENLMTFSVVATKKKNRQKSDFCEIWKIKSCLSRDFQRRPTFFELWNEGHPGALQSCQLSDFSCVGSQRDSQKNKNHVATWSLTPYRQIIFLNEALETPRRAAGRHLQIENLTSVDGDRDSESLAQFCFLL